VSGPRDRIEGSSKALTTNVIPPLGDFPNNAFRGLSSTGMVRAYSPSVLHRVLSLQTILSYLALLTSTTQGR
jgi:hypothetical protein